MEEPAVDDVGSRSDRDTSARDPRLVEEKLGARPEVSFDEWREGDQKVYVSDVGRAREQLDWGPRVGFEDGIERYIEWAREAGVV